MEGLKPNKVGFKLVSTSCPQHGVVDNCCLCPGGYDCLTHTKIEEGGYCKNKKYTKSTSELDPTSGTMIETKTNARDVCNHCMNKRRLKDNCASALLELNKDAYDYDIESIKKCALALLSLGEEKKGEEPPRKKPKKDGKRKVKSRRKSKSRRRKSKK